MYQPQLYTIKKNNVITKIVISFPDLRKFDICIVMKTDEANAV